MKNFYATFPFIYDCISDGEWKISDSQLEEAFSALEKACFSLYKESDARLIRRIIPMMKNLKILILREELPLESSLLGDLKSSESVEHFYMTFYEDSFDLMMEKIAKMPNLKYISLTYLGNEIFDASRLKKHLSRMENLQHISIYGHLNGTKLLSKLKKLPNLNYVTLSVLLEGTKSFSLHDYSYVSFDSKDYPFEVTLKMETPSHASIAKATSPKKKTSNEMRDFWEPKEFFNFLPQGIGYLSLSFSQLDGEFLNFLWQWLKKGHGRSLQDLKVKYVATEEQCKKLENAIALFKNWYSVEVHNYVDDAISD